MVSDLSPRKVKAGVGPDLETGDGFFLCCVCGWERQGEQGK